MKNKFRKFTAITLSALMLTAAVSCGKNNEDITDSQESSSQSEETGKTEITVASTVTSKGEFFSNKINAFESDLYTVNFINYLDMALEIHTGDGPVEDTAYKLLSQDMVSGKCPDVIISNADFMTDLLDKDYFTDLYPLMETSDVKREDFLPNVLEGFEREGKLPLITSGFYIRTAAAKTEHVGADAEHWTFDEMTEICSTMPSGMSLIGPLMNEYELPGYVLTQIQRDCVDLDNASCDFQGLFLDAFDFVLENNMKVKGSELTDTEWDELNEARQNCIEKDTALVSAYTINGINNGISYWLSEFGESDFTFVGYPSKDGCGAVTDTSVMDMFGILENSDCKEGAWELISGFFDPGYQANSTLHFGGIPVIDSAIDSAMEYSQFTVSSINSPFETDESGNTVSQISEENKNKVADYLRSVEIRPYYSGETDYIINEEAVKGILGKSSPQECADMIENRLNIFLSEQQ